MRSMPRLPKSETIRNAIIYLASAFVIAASTIAIIIMVYPFDVIKDWTTTTDKTTYVEGELVTISTRYDKMIDARADPLQRGLECKNSNGSLQTYPILTSSSNAMVTDNGFMTYVLTIPRDAINGLPTDCRIVVDARYRVFAIHTVEEHNASNWFRVTPFPRPVSQ